MSNEELYKLLKDKEFTIEDVINAIIQINGIVGVGKISLGDTLKDYCYHRAKDYNSKGVDLVSLQDYSEQAGKLESSESVGIKKGGGEWQSNHRNGMTL